MLEEMPPLALSQSLESTNIEVNTENVDILDSILEILSNYCLNFSKNDEDKSQDVRIDNILSVMLGLSIKRGSLCQILNSLRFLLLNNSNAGRGKRSNAEKNLEAVSPMYLEVIVLLYVYIYIKINLMS